MKYLNTFIQHVKKRKGIVLSSGNSSILLAMARSRWFLGCPRTKDTFRRKNFNTLAHVTLKNHAYRNLKTSYLFLHFSLKMHPDFKNVKIWKYCSIELGNIFMIRNLPILLQNCPVWELNLNVHVYGNVNLLIYFLVWMAWKIEAQYTI